MSSSVDTQELLAESFKGLLLEKPFNKITIKDITNRAGVIRPTFYNYFQDKSAVFEFILDEELFKSLEKLMDVGMLDEAVSMIFVYFDKNQDFYIKAFETEGQNSFEEILTERMEGFMALLFDHYNYEGIPELHMFGPDALVGYYARVTVLLIKVWLQDISAQTHDVQDIIKAYKFLATHSILDIFGEELN